MDAPITKPTNTRPNNKICRERNHMTPVEYALYTFARQVSHESKQFYFDGRKTAAEFLTASKDTMYRASKRLKDRGWFIEVRPAKRLKNGMFCHATFEVLTHEEWIRKHGTGKCKIDTRVKCESNAASRSEARQFSRGNMTKKEAEKIVGRIYTNSKMPCGSYTLPCDSCHVGKTLRSNPNSPCAHCYARKGCAKAFAKYVDPFRAHKLVALNHPQWQEAMVTMLKGKSYFRWHDAGDLQSVAHLRQIVSLVNATPWCQHWMSTKEFNIVRQFLASGGVIPNNLTIRLSAYIIDHGCKPNGLIQLTTSTVQRDSKPIGFACPAPNQGGRCNTCRACWSNKIKNVSYHIH